jgi:Fe-S cluster biogenesis protein NfuA
METPEQPGMPGRPLRDRVASVIEEIRPFIQRDGGDIELVDVSDAGEVRVRLQGACVSCPMSQMTMSMGVERRVRQQVPEVTQVVLVPSG